MKSHKNAKLGLLQNLNELGKIGLRIGFWQAQKPPQAIFQDPRRKKRFWPPASQLEERVMVPHWAKCRYWTHEHIFSPSNNKAPYLLNISQV